MQDQQSMTLSFNSGPQHSCACTQTHTCTHTQVHHTYAKTCICTHGHITHRHTPQKNKLEKGKRQASLEFLGSLPSPELQLVALFWKIVEPLGFRCSLHEVSPWGSRSHGFISCLLCLLSSHSVIGHRVLLPQSLLLQWAVSPKL